MKRSRLSSLSSFAHFAVSDLTKKRFWSAEKISRGALGLAGADENQLNLWVEKWALKEDTNKNWHLVAKQDDYDLDLLLKPKKPEVMHGQDGVSQKSEGIGKATHYVSFTRMEAQGSLTTAGQTQQVFGTTWYDHEFGSNQLSADQAGWDWFSLQLDSGEELMIYLLRKKNGCFETASSGTFIDAQGKATHLKIDELSVLSKSTWKSPLTKAVYPAIWEIRIPRFNISVTVVPLISNQELVLQETGKMAYWEGACHVRGTHTGRAYVELTGYDHPMENTPLSGK